jgi:hypothetical protein
VRGAAALVLLSILAFSGTADAFPGVCLGKDSAPRLVPSTQIVVMQERGVSVVTISADYEGPLAPFALLLPVPTDVSAERVRTVKRSIIARLDEVSAPRLHAFYEQDPCDGGRTEQRWDEHIKAQGRGFLAADGLPPLDRRYAISNEISAPIEPVFKGKENEFRYRKLEPASVAELSAALRDKGYAVSDAALQALAPYVGKGKALLLAEVLTEHVELVDAKRVKLGGIRYFTKFALGALPVTLGRQNAPAVQDLQVYVLDRKSRYAAKNYENLFAPSNLRVAERVKSQLGRAYAALFDALAAPSRAAFVTEYAWSTRGCGQPCADAPLGLDELMSLGGDVLEAETASAAERRGEPALEQERDRAKFEQQLAALRPAERAAERREHARVLGELGRRRALMARQTYVLSRLHGRYEAKSLSRDLELAPAEAVSGGVGVPQGKYGELAREAKPAAQNELQVRFVALHDWNGGVGCAAPARYRWGKPWASEARASRAVPLALDLAASPGDRQLLLGALETPLPELGIGRKELRHAAATAAPPLPSSAPVPPATGKGSCATAAPGRSSSSGTPGLLVLAVFLLSARARRARPQARAHR